VLSESREGGGGALLRKFQVMKSERKPGIQNDGTADSKSNIIEDQRQVLRIWENYISELYDQPNRQLNLEVKPEEEVHRRERLLHGTK